VISCRRNIEGEFKKHIKNSESINLYLLNESETSLVKHFGHLLFPKSPRGSMPEMGNEEIIEVLSHAWRLVNLASRESARCQHIAHDDDKHMHVHCVAGQLRTLIVR
jgi:hypothetical protein